MTNATELIQRAIRMYPTIDSLVSAPASEFNQIKEIVDEAIRLLRGRGTTIPAELSDYSTKVNAALSRRSATTKSESQDLDQQNQDDVDPNDLGFTDGEGSSIVRDAVDWLNAQNATEMSIKANNLAANVRKSAQNKQLIIIAVVAAVALGGIYFLSKK